MRITSSVILSATPFCLQSSIRIRVTSVSVTAASAHRFFYAFSTAFICKHDNTHKWEPNYSNVLGNMIAGEISSTYYPGGAPTKVGSVIETGLTVTFEGSFGGELQEFWPDISRKFFHKDPTHGLDAQAKADDAAAKQKKQQEEGQKHQP